MSAWKRSALEKLPEYRPIIDRADNPMALWIELHMKFAEAYRETKLNDDLIHRIFEYARWCMQTRGEGKYLSDAGTATVCAFYEHLPQDSAIRGDLPRWLTKEEFSDLREAFRYHLSEENFAAFEKEFLATKNVRARK